MINKNYYLIQLLYVFLLSISITSTSMAECSSRLLTPFDFSKFRRCQNLVRRYCPPKPLLPETVCTQKIFTQNRVCQQSQALMRLLGTDIYLTKVVKRDGFFILSHTMIADGQDNYNIITPKGCIFSTIVDIRKYDPHLRRKYASLEF